jgi:hypothetical protein
MLILPCTLLKDFIHFFFFLTRYRITILHLRIQRFGIEYKNNFFPKKKKKKHINVDRCRDPIIL